MVNFFYSVNFSIVSYRKAELNLQIFSNRVKMFLLKKAKCERKKLMELIPVFFKIVQEEMCNFENRDKFYHK